METELVHSGHGSSNQCGLFRIVFKGMGEWSGYLFYSMEGEAKPRMMVSTTTVRILEYSHLFMLPMEEAPGFTVRLGRICIWTRRVSKAFDAGFPPKQVRHLVVLHQYVAGFPMDLYPSTKTKPPVAGSKGLGSRRGSFLLGDIEHVIHCF
jgi:hypothetical protein